MRFGLLALTPVAALSLGTVVPVSAAPQEPTHPIQIGVRVEHVIFKGEPFAKVTGGAVSELREKGWVVDEAAEALRPAIAASVSSGRAAITGDMLIAMLEGVGARVDTVGKVQPGLSAAFVPRLKDGKIELDFKLVYGKRVDGRLSGELVEQKVLVSSGGTVAVRLPGTKESPAEHVVLLHVFRRDP